MFSPCFCFDLFLSGVVLSLRGIIAAASNDNPELKEGQMAGGPWARKPTFVGAINAGHAFSHNM
jgi:hypothetical protein